MLSGGVDDTRGLLKKRVSTKVLHLVRPSRGLQKYDKSFGVLGFLANAVEQHLVFVCFCSSAEILCFHTLPLTLTVNRPLSLIATGALSEISTDFRRNFDHVLSRT